MDDMDVAWDAMIKKVRAKLTDCSKKEKKEVFSFLISILKLVVGEPASPG